MIAWRSILTVPIVVAIAFTANLTAQIPNLRDVWSVGNSLGQTVTSDGRYTTQTSDLGVSLVDIPSGQANLLVAAEHRSKRLRFPAYASAISPDGKLIAF